MIADMPCSVDWDSCGRPWQGFYRKACTAPLRGQSVGACSCRKVDTSNTAWGLWRLVAAASAAASGAWRSAPYGPAQDCFGELEHAASAARGVLGRGSRLYLRADRAPIGSWPPWEAFGVRQEAPIGADGEPEGR